MARNAADKHVARERRDADELFNNVIDDPHEAARHRLQRRLAANSANTSSRVPHSQRSQRNSTPKAEDLLVGHIPHPLIVLGIMVVCILAFIGLGALVNNREAPLQPESSSTQETSSQPPEETSQTHEQPNFTLLPTAIDPQLKASLISLAESDPRVAHIINTIKTSLANDGDIEQLKMLKLIVEEPQAIDFVAGLSKNYPAQTAQPYNETVQRGETPLLLQWDPRWGYTRYCNLSFASAGCCPTSLSMVYMGLTGKNDLNPADMARLATEGGYAVDLQGTIGTFLIDIAPSLGLQCEEFAPDLHSLNVYLESGYTVICNVGPGDFTDMGHFIVITGKNANGSLDIKDPYSIERTNKQWDTQAVVNQSIALYAFKARA